MLNRTGKRSTRPADPGIRACMSDVLFDQAAGLRKLLARGALRTLTVASAERGSGRSLIAASLAVALARQGQEVVLLDCGTDDQRAAKLLGAEPASDWLASTRRRFGTADATAEGCAGVRVMRADLMLDWLPRLSEKEAGQLSESFANLHPGAGMLVIDAPVGDLVLAAAARELLLVVGPDPDAITSSYRYLKRLRAEGGAGFVEVVVNRAQSAPHADKIFGNLSSTSRRFLSLPLELMGRIPQDDRLARALRLRQPVMDVFPQAPGAMALQQCVANLLRWPNTGEDGLAAFTSRLLEMGRGMRAGPSGR